MATNLICDRLADAARAVLALELDGEGSPVEHADIVATFAELRASVAAQDGHAPAPVLTERNTHPVAWRPL